MGKKSLNSNRHPNQFCSSCQPLLQQLYLQVQRKTTFCNITQRQIIDELELIDIEAKGDCSCRVPISIMIEAGNFTKWMRLLFSEQQSKFKKSSVDLPSQYQEVKREIQVLVYDLHLKMLMSTISNQQQQEIKVHQHKSKKINKKKRPISRISRRLPGYTMKTQPNNQNENQNYNFDNHIKML